MPLACSQQTQLAKRADAAAKAASQSQKKAQKVPGAKLPPTRGIVGFDKSLNWKVAQDTYLFAREPADPLLGGRPNAPGRFKGNFVHSLGRVSNMMYSIAAFAKDPVRNGVRFTRHKMPKCIAKERVWVPPPGHAKGGPGAPDPDILLDCVSTDLWPDPYQVPAPHSLTIDVLHRAIEAKKPKVSCACWDP